MGTVNVDDEVWLSEIARRLGVPRQNVLNWDRRRKSTGFPPALGERVRFGRVVRVWSWKAVSEWRRDWVPDLGGRPALKKPVDMSARSA